MSVFTQWLYYEAIIYENEQLSAGDMSDAKVLVTESQVLVLDLDAQVKSWSW